MGLNPISVLGGMTIKPMLANDVARAQVRRLMTEALAVGQAMGVVDEVDVDARIEYAARLDDVKTSMLQDFERGRALEIDPILGAVCELGERYGVADAGRRRSVCRPAATRHCEMIAQSAAPLPISALAGVGPKIAALFASWESIRRRRCSSICRFATTICAFPRRRRVWDAAAARRMPSATIVALKERRVRGLEIVEAQLRDDAGGLFAAKWIGRNRYVYGRFREGMRLFVRGRVERTLCGAGVNVSQYGTLGEGETYRGELVPVYRATKDLASRKIAAVVKKNLSRLLDLAPPDAIPSALAEHARLCVAARRISRRPRAADAGGGRDARANVSSSPSFLMLATGAQLRRAERESDHDAHALDVPAGLLERFEAALPVRAHRRAAARRFARSGTTCAATFR